MEQHINTPIINNKNLILIRWIAIVGQTSAVLFTFFILNIAIPIVEVSACIAISILVNGISNYWHGHKNLNEKNTSIYLLYDIIQLSIILYLTGGIHNPFVIFIIAPAAIAASVLTIKYVTFITVSTIISVAVINFHYMDIDLNTSDKLNSLNLHDTGQFISICLVIALTSFYIWRISYDNHATQTALRASQKALSRQKKIAALGSLATSAAHELGSPLSTIAIIAKDLKEELNTSCDRVCPMEKDIDLLIQQSDRCKDIITDLSLCPNKDNILDPIKPELLVDLITKNFMVENPSIEVEISSDCDKISDELLLHKTPEITHAIGVIIQNALQFAKNKVDIKTYYDNNIFSITIKDDGEGFPPKILANIGQPYVSTRLDNGTNLGLGIFIASNIIESIKGNIEFSNSDQGGALVQIIWHRTDIEFHSNS